MRTGQPQPASAAERYDTQYRTWLGRQGPRALDREWRLARLLWRQRVLLRRYPPRGKRALDFGCMDGIFTFRLRQLGARAVGYDVSPAAIGAAVAFRGRDAEPGFTTEPPPPASFDLVYCSEVLEHADDDTAMAAELVRFLAPGGRLVGTTPVGRHFWDADHKRAYDAASLRSVLAPHGVVTISRFYRTALRNLLPVRQRGAAVFVFSVARA